MKTKALQLGGKLYGDLKNDLGGFIPIGVHKDWVISIVSTKSVISRKGLKNDDLVNDIINNTSISDNPILSFQRLKDF